MKTTDGKSREVTDSSWPKETREKQFSKSNAKQHGTMIEAENARVVRNLRTD